MSEQKHSKEPWRLPVEGDDHSGATVLRPDGYLIADCNIFGSSAPPERECDTNAERIVTAVNACAGIPSESLSPGVVAELVGAFAVLHKAAVRSLGDHTAPGDCYVTGHPDSPDTIDMINALVRCPGCELQGVVENTRALLAKLEATE